MPKMVELYNSLTWTDSISRSLLFTSSNKGCELTSSSSITISLSWIPIISLPITRTAESGGGNKSGIAIAAGRAGAGILFYIFI